MQNQFKIVVRWLMHAQILHFTILTPSVGAGHSIHGKVDGWVSQMFVMKYQNLPSAENENS
jgi:hypothetical protein